MKILLAEDQAMVRGALASLITLSSPHQIVEAADGDVAYQLLKSDHFDLLLTDIEMPGRSGLELAAWLQQQKSPTKVVVITTFGRSGYIFNNRGRRQGKGCHPQIFKQSVYRIECLFCLFKNQD